MSEDRHQSHLEAFGSRVRCLREMRHWSQTDLGDRVGSSGPVISRIENGVSWPPMMLIHRICDALEMPFELLMAKPYDSRGGRPPKARDDEQHAAAPGGAS